MALLKFKVMNNNNLNLKSFFLTLSILCLLFAGCKKNNTEFATVNVRVSDFSITQEDINSKEDPASYNPVKAITLAFFGSTNYMAYMYTQYKNNPSTYTTFGTFSANVPVGNYTIVAVAYAYNEGDNFALTSLTNAGYSSERPRETFCATQEVTVTSSSTLNLEVALNRISSMLQIASTDGRPAEATKIRTTFSKGGKGFNPTTGLAKTDNGFAQTNSPSTGVGGNVTVSIFPFLYTDEESMNITIEALDANDNVLITKTISDVPFKRNRKTILSGAVYTPNNSGASFTLNTEWLPDHNVSF